MVRARRRKNTSPPLDSTELIRIAKEIPVNRRLIDLKFLSCATLSRMIVLVAVACLCFTGGAVAQTLTTTIKYGPSNIETLPPPLVDAAANKIYLPVNNALLIVDGQTNAVTTLTTPGSYGTGAAINVLTNKFYFTGPDLLVVDGKTNTMTNVPITNPRSLAVDPSLNVVYTADATFVRSSAMLHVVDGVTNLLKDFPLPAGAADLVVNPVTHKLYIPHCDGTDPGEDSHYSVYSAGAETPVTFTIQGHECNFRAAVNVATNRIYFLNSDIPPTIQVVDGSSDNVIAQIDLPTNPRRIVANPITNKIYALCDGGNLVVLDGATNQSSIVHTDPNSISESLAINLSTNQIYFTDGFGGVNVVDGDTLGVTFLPIPGGARGVAVNPITNKAYATQNASNLFVIDGAFNKPTRIAAGVSPLAAATNPVTGKAYVANSGEGTVTEIDGTTGATVNIPVGATPVAVAVDSATNRIYVANKDSNNVTVIDGTTRGTSVVAAGTAPVAGGVNSANNQIYVASEGVADVTVIDGSNNSTQRVSVEALSTAIAVNPNTNLVYVADDNAAVRVIDGATNGETVVGVGRGPVSISVNPVTNKIYVANAIENTVSVIDGATNAVTSVPSGVGPVAVAVNPTSNKIYVVDGENNAMVMDGDTNTTSKVAVGSVPVAMAVDPTLNKIYVANSSSADVTVIAERQNKAIPLTTTIAPTSFTSRTSPVSNPEFSFTLSSAFVPSSTTPLDAFFQVDTWRGPWTRATSSAGAFSGQVPSLGIGDHIIYAYAGDGQDSTMVSRQQLNVGAIAAYPFTVQGVTSVQPQIILSVANATVTVTRGGSATYSISVTAQGALPTAVTFSCGPLPANTTCTFVTSTVNATNVPTTVTLTVRTTAPTVAMNAPINLTKPSLLFAVGLFFPALVVCASVGNRRRAEVRGKRWSSIGVMTLLLLSLVACGSDAKPPIVRTSTGGTPTGTFTVTVTSSAGSVQATTALTLKVQ